MYAHPVDCGAPTRFAHPEQPLPRAAECPGVAVGGASGTVDAGAAAGPDPTWGSVRPGRYGWGGPAAKERRLDLTAGLLPRRGPAPDRPPTLGHGSSFARRRAASAIALVRASSRWLRSASKVSTGTPTTTTTSSSQITRPAFVGGTTLRRGVAQAAAAPRRPAPAAPTGSARPRRRRSQ